MSEDLLTVKIASIIDRSRYHEESILIDSTTAAKDILDYLKKDRVMCSDLPIALSADTSNINY